MSESINKAFSDLLAIMIDLDDTPYPPREERGPGWLAKFQVRCSGCGKFAKILNSGTGYDSRDGSYDPWYEVECKRCGLTEGYIYQD